MSNRVITRQATRDDINAFSSAANKPTVKAWCIEADGKVIALGGLAFSHARWFAFCDLTPEAREYKMAIARTSRKVFDEAKQSGIRFIYAAADPKEPRAVDWMSWLGFELDPRSQYLYRWSAR